jgi:hypothetical protein
MEDMGFKRLMRRLGTNGPGLTVAVVAMIVALTGGAFAATGALTGKQKKEVKTIAKQYAGKPGQTGAPGSQGAAGPVGAKGDTGGQGVPGKDGTSVTVSEIEAGEPECEAQGGAIVKDNKASSVEIEICNGKDGSPWTAGGTLPPEATETGSWAFTGSSEDPSDVEKILVPISFPVPLAAERLKGADVHFSGEAEAANFFGPDKDCPTGIEDFPPAALPGKLCVYVTSGAGFEYKAIRSSFTTNKGAGSAGGYLEFVATEPVANASGVFAVTGCETEVTELEGTLCVASP